MLIGPSCVDEKRRLDVLRGYAIVDTPADERFDNLTRMAQVLTGAPIAAISLIEKDRLWLKSKLGLECTEVPRSLTFCNHTIIEQGPVVVCDATADDRFRDNPLVLQAPNVRFYAGMPLITKENAILGALFVFDTRTRPSLLPHERDGLYALSRIVVDAIELHSLATHDSLTNVLTNGALRRAAKKQLDHEKRHNRPLSIIAIDIDHFKGVNDEHGHAAGDAVLREVAAVLRSGSRPTDIVGRIGGEEFVVVLPETGIDGAMDYAERLRARLASASIPTTNEPLKVTASLGVSQVNALSETFEEVLERADKALYRSKKAGRNRVTKDDGRVSNV